MAEDAPEDQTLNAQRSALLAFFSDRVRADGIVIKPQGIERDMNLAQRLYWEQSNEREFSIAWSDPARPRLDAFVKRTGLNNERELLYVTSAIGCGFEAVLWRLYLGWMHDGIGEKVAISLATAPR